MPRLLTLLSLVVFLSPTAGVGGSPCAAGVEITDDLNHSISLDEPARRVIPLYGAFSEMLFAIGAGDRVIARTRADHHPPQITELPSVGTHMRPNVEIILGLKPDLVVQSASRHAASPEIKRLEDAGIPVAVFSPQSFRGVFSVMERLGALTGRSEQAREVTKQLKERLDAVRGRIPSTGDKPTVFFEVRATPLTAAGRGSIVHEVLTAAGAENVVEGRRSMMQYSIEALLLKDPRYYIIQEGPMNRNPMAPDKRPHFQRLTAVKEGRVLWVDESIFSRPGPRIVEAVEKLAAILYSERFGEGALQSSGNENASGAPGEPVAWTTGARSSLSLETIYQRLVKPLVRLSVFIAIGLLIGNLIEGLQWTHHLGRLARPLLRWGHLSDHSAVAFMAAFFSGVTANTMLMNAYREEKLNRKELYFSSLVNTLPSFFLHLPTTFFILLPLVRMAGVLYLGVTLLATLVRTICLLMVSRYVLPRRDYDLPAHERSQLQKGEILQKTWKKFKKRFSKILLLTLPIYTLFFFLNHYGLFRWLEDQLAKLVSIRVIPIDALSVVVFQVMTEFAAGAAAAGALLDSGTLTVKTTVLALLIGNIISTPVRALRHQLPYYMGIYSPRLGLSLLLVNQSARVLSVFLMMLAFYWFYWG